MRDETLLQSARTLEAKAAQIATTSAETHYGITTARVTEILKEADNYAALIMAPDDAFSARTVSQQKTALTLHVSAKRRTLRVDCR